MKPNAEREIEMLNVNRRLGRFILAVGLLLGALAAGPHGYAQQLKKIVDFLRRVWIEKVLKT